MVLSKVRHTTQVPHLVVCNLEWQLRGDKAYLVKHLAVECGQWFDCQVLVCLLISKIGKVGMVQHCMVESYSNFTQS